MEIERARKREKGDGESHNIYYLFQRKSWCSSILMVEGQTHFTIGTCLLVCFIGPMIVVGE